MKHEPHKSPIKPNTKLKKKEWCPTWGLFAIILLLDGILIIILHLYAGVTSFDHNRLFEERFEILTCLAFVGIIIKIVLLHKNGEQQWNNMQHFPKKSNKLTKVASFKVSQHGKAYQKLVAQWKTEHNKEQREIFYLQGRNYMINDLENGKHHLTLFTCFLHQYGPVSQSKAIHEFVDQFYFLSTICMRLSTEWKTTAIDFILEKMSNEMCNQFKHAYKRLYAKKRLPAIRSKYKYYQFYSLAGISVILQNLAMISNWLARTNAWIQRMAKIENSAEYYERLVIDKLTEEEAICLYISKLYLECQNHDISKLYIEHQNHEIYQNNCQRYLDHLQHLYRNRRWPAEHEMLLRLLGLHNPSLEDIDDSISIIIYKINHFDKNNTFYTEPESDQEDIEQDSNISN